MTFVKCSNGHQSPTGSRFCSYCGEVLQVSSDNPQISATKASSRLCLHNRYLIQRLIGQGGFGKAYLAEDLGRFGELVTIKEFCPSLQGTQALEKAKTLFQREAATLHKLKHPQIPQFYEFFQEGERFFLVQEFIRGQTYQSLLDQRLQQDHLFTEIEILHLMEGLLPVLAYLHEQGIIHRDVAPDNIICRSGDGIPILIDLGGIKKIAITIAKQVSGVQKSTATRLGKIGYAPDEQIRLGIVAPHSDLYALAVTAIVLMTGKQPQQLLNQNTLQWVWHQEIQISPWLEKVLNRMLHRQPAQRFQSATEVLQIVKSGSFKQVDVPLQIAQTNVKLPTTVLTSPTTNPASQNGRISPSVVLNEIKTWNWGAFFLPGFWCFSNRVWLGLLVWATIFSSLWISTATTFGVALLLGMKGNEWAWKSRNWNSIAAFKAHQRAWTKWALVIQGSLFSLGLLIVFLIASTPEFQEAFLEGYEQGVSDLPESSPPQPNESSVRSSNSSNRELDDLNNVYPSEVVSAMIFSCKKTALTTNPNASAELVDNYCICAINRFQERMSFQDYVVAEQAIFKLQNKQKINANEQEFANRFTSLLNEVITSCLASTFQ